MSKKLPSKESMIDKKTITQLVKIEKFLDINKDRHKKNEPGDPIDTQN